MQPLNMIRSKTIPALFPRVSRSLSTFPQVPGVPQFVRSPPKRQGRPQKKYQVTESGIVFKNPSKIKENVKTYLLYLRTKDMKEMYFTNEKGDKSDRPYYYLTKKAAYNLFHPFLDIKLLKFPLYYTTKEPKNWSLCRLDNLLFFDKATKNQYLTNSTSLFQSAVRVTSQNVQLLALLKHAEKERIKQEGGGEATEGSSPTTEKQ